MVINESEFNFLKKVEKSAKDGLNIKAYSIIRNYDKVDINEIISNLLELDLIEVETDVNVYFLTPEGYDQIELYENPDYDFLFMDNEEPIQDAYLIGVEFSFKKMKKSILNLLFFGAILIVVINLLFD